MSKKNRFLYGKVKAQGKKKKPNFVPKNMRLAKVEFKKNRWSPAQQESKYKKQARNSLVVRKMTDEERAKYLNDP